MLLLVCLMYLLSVLWWFSLCCRVMNCLGLCWNEMKNSLVLSRLRLFMLLV